MENRHTRVLIIGSGPAGYSAAIYAARASLKPMLVTGIQPGGQLTITTDVENYPGFAEAIQGPWLMEQMQAQAEQVGVSIIHDTIVEVLLNQKPIVLIGDSGARYSTDTLIIATGAQARWLGLESEKNYSGFGVSACATCDGFFYRGKQVAVIGGGNSAVEEALYLTNHASKVTLIHRGPSLRAEKILQDRLLQNPKIDIIFDSVVEEVLGTVTPLRSVTGLRLRNVTTDAISELALDGVFVAIGHTPSSGLFKADIETDAAGYIRIAPWSTQTSLEGVFAAGDVADPKFRQAITAAGMGCMAALEAERYLASQPANMTEQAA